MTRAAAAASLGWAWFLAAAGPCGAEPPPSSGSVPSQAAEVVRLSWFRDEGADACPGQAAIERAVRDRLGRDAFSQESGREPTLSIEARVAPETDGFRATLLARDARGTTLGRRTLHVSGTDCSALARPVAMALALVIDPDAPEPPPESGPAHPAAPSPAPVPSPTDVPPVLVAPPSAPAPAPAPVARATFGVQARAWLMAGVVGPVSWGAGGMVTLGRVGPVRFAAGGGWIAYATLVDGGNGDAPSVRAGLGVAVAEGCPVWQVHPVVHMGGCVSVLAGVLQLRPTVAVETGTAIDRPWLAAAAGARVEFGPPTGWSVSVGADGLVPFLRTRVTFQGSTIGGEAWPVAFQTHASVGARF